MRVLNGIRVSGQDGNKLHQKNGSIGTKKVGKIGEGLVRVNHKRILHGTLSQISSSVILYKFKTSLRLDGLRSRVK